jgi:hypothetical protein
MEITGKSAILVKKIKAMQKAFDLKKHAEAYQPLFDLMYQEHGITLTIGQMDEIIDAVNKVDDNHLELYREVCDVEGCNNEPSSGGAYWKDEGYWVLCSAHFRKGMDGEPMPTMKNEAIARETSRQPNGQLFIPVSLSDQRLMEMPFSEAIGKETGTMLENTT